MKLQETLDSLSAETTVAPELADALRRTVAYLVNSGTAQRALKAGDHMPEFALPNSGGRLVRSDSLLGHGPLVITFYSGMWCPFGNAELDALEAVHEEVLARGAVMIAISQQTPANNGRVERFRKLGFPILSDRNGTIGDAFGLRCVMAPDLLQAYRLIGLDLSVMNGEDSGTLSMSARYVMDTDGSICYAEVNADYTHRPDPTEILPTLDLLARKRNEAEN